MIKPQKFLIKTKRAIAPNECYGVLTDIQLRIQSISIPIFRFYFAIQAISFWKRNNLIAVKRDQLACSKYCFGLFFRKQFERFSISLFYNSNPFQALRFWKRNTLITEKRDKLACVKLRSNFRFDIHFGYKMCFEKEKWI